MSARLPGFLLRRLQRWADRVMDSRPPDFVIDAPGRPYLERWFAIPRNRLFNIYLHRVLRSDDDRALHDHPWVNASVILRTGYFELLPLEQTPEGRSLGPFRMIRRRVGEIVLRGPRTAHRLVTRSDCDDFYRRWRPAETLFLTGPKLRTWGFWCTGRDRLGAREEGDAWPRFVPWKDFVDPSDPGRPGPGCGG